jgi:hypothetical protein
MTSGFVSVDLDLHGTFAHVCIDLTDLPIGSSSFPTCMLWLPLSGNLSRLATRHQTGPWKISAVPCFSLLCSAIPRDR